MRPTLVANHKTKEWAIFQDRMTTSMVVWQPIRRAQMLEAGFEPIARITGPATAFQLEKGGYTQVSGNSFTKPVEEPLTESQQYKDDQATIKQLLADKDRLFKDNKVLKNLMNDIRKLIK